MQGIAIGAIGNESALDWCILAKACCTQARASSFLKVLGGGGGDTEDGAWARDAGGGGVPPLADEPVVPWGGGPWFKPEAPKVEGGGGPWGSGGEVDSADPCVGGVPSPRLLNVEPVGGATEGGGLLLARLLSPEPEPPVGGVLLAKLLEVEPPVGGWVGGVLVPKALKVEAPVGGGPCVGGGPWLGGGVEPRGGAAPPKMPDVAPVGGVAPVCCMLGDVAGGAVGGTPACWRVFVTLWHDGFSSIQHYKIQNNNVASGQTNLKVSMF